MRENDSLTRRSFVRLGGLVGLAGVSGVASATPGRSSSLRQGTLALRGLTLAQWDLTNSELRAHLKNTAVDIGLSSGQQGAGRVDAGTVVTTSPQ